jgi:hypothetical protein
MPTAPGVQDPRDIQRALDAHDRIVQETGTPAADDALQPAGDAVELSQAEEHQVNQEIESRLEQMERENASLRLQMEQALEMVRKIAETGGNITQKAVLQEQRKERMRLSEAMLEGLRRRGGNVVVLIHPDPDPKKNFPVPLNHNGHAIQIPRGKPCSIDHKFVEILEHARSEGHVPVLDANENPAMQAIDQYSYPYSIINQMPIERPDVVQIT